MKRGVWILLALSLALNIGFVSAALVHWAGSRNADRFADRGFGPGGDGRWSEEHPGRGRGDRGRRLSRRGGPPPALFDHWPGRRIEHLDREVGLDPEQRRLLHERLGELRDEIRDNAAALREERQSLQRALAGGDLQAEQVRGHARHVAELQARMDSLVTEAIIRENAILRPEQRERYRDMEWGPMENAGPPPAVP